MTVGGFESSRRELRYALIAELTGVAAKLHVLLQMYRRTKNLTEEAQQSMARQRRWWSRYRTQATHPSELAASWDRVRELRTELDDQYLECRRDGEVLEARLVAHFVDTANVVAGFLIRPRARHAALVLSDGGAAKVAGEGRLLVVARLGGLPTP